MSQTVRGLGDPPHLARDPGDDYLIALTRSTAAAALVSGDADLLALEGADISVLTPRDFLASLKTLK